MVIRSSISIKAPIEKVFDVFSDLGKAEKRIKGIDKIEILEGPAKMEIGTKWRETRTMFGKEATEVMWVTGLEKPKSYVVEAESRGTHYRSEYKFSEVDGQTLVELSFEGKPLSFGAKVMSMLFFMFKGATKKALQKDLEDLKTVLEA